MLWPELSPEELAEVEASFLDLEDLPQPPIFSPKRSVTGSAKRLRPGSPSFMPTRDSGRLGGDSPRRPTGSSRQPRRTDPPSDASDTEDSSPTTRRRRSGPDRSAKGRAWAVTWNNPGSPEHAGSESDALNLFRSLPGAVRLLAGREVAPTTGTPHLQALAIFQNPVRRNWLRVHLPGADCRPIEGGPLGVKKYEFYCKKDKDVPIDWDSRYNRDKKALLTKEEVAQEKSVYRQALLGDPGPLVEKAGEKWVFTNLRKIREATAYGPQLLVGAQRRSLPTVLWLYGPAGAGKSHFVECLLDALALPARSVFCLSNPDEKKATWWDGMTCLTEVVNCDDLRPTTWSSGGFCQAISRFPTRVDAKGFTVDFCAWLVLITTPGPPWSFWRLSEGQGEVDQITRRIAWCAEFIGAPSPPPITLAAQTSSTFVIPQPDGAAEDPWASVRQSGRCVTPAPLTEAQVQANARERAKLRASMNKFRVRFDWRDELDVRVAGHVAKLLEDAEIIT